MNSELLLKVFILFTVGQGRELRLPDLAWDVPLFVCLSPFSPPDGDRRVDPPALSGRVPGLPSTPQDEAATRLPSPWDSPGKNTGVGCHFLLQRMKVKSESEVAQSFARR